MRIGELAEGGYLTCWNDAEHFEPKDMAEVIAHFRDARYCDLSHDYCIGYYHENGNYISDGMSHIGFEKFDYYMYIPPLPYRKERE